MITRYDSCLRKVSYATKRKAEEIADLMAEKHQNYDFKVYECNFCDGWHIAKAGISEYLRNIKYD